jgi:Protein of unknown function (DUF2934)
MAKRPTSPTNTPNPDGPARPKTRKTKPASTADSAPPSPEPSADEIRRRAYERYQERGGNHGQHFDDWVEAEKELRSKK